MRAFETEKTEVAEIDRSVYDIKDKVNAAFEVNSGLTAEIVEQISKEKHDPDWMREFRLKALDIYNKASLPNWGPSLEGLDMRNIVTYVRPNTEMRGKWSEVPDDIKNTFERLGIPQAERSSLAGVGAQYDSEVVYHNVKEEVAAQGVVYTDMESALKGEYADMVKEHFMKCVPPTDHKFAALHGAVWSGGSFVYVPAGVHVDIPLQSYFRLNAPGAVGRLVCLRARWYQAGFPAAELLPPECEGRRPVRAHPDYRGQGRIPALYRGLLGPEVQRRQPARRLRRDFRR